MFTENLSEDYAFSIVEDGGLRKGVWTRSDAEGVHTIYVRGDFFQAGTPQLDAPESDDNPYDVLEGPLQVAGQDILLKVRFRPAMWSSGPSTHEVCWTCTAGRIHASIFRCPAPR